MHNNDRARCALLTSSHPVAARTREALERESKRERERERRRLKTRGAKEFNLILLY